MLVFVYPGGFYNRFVSDKMGGPIERDRLHEFSWELHISEIEYELKCNVVPIGKINKGTFYHRALLFKVSTSHHPIICIRNLVICLISINSANSL